MGFHQFHNQSGQNVSRYIIGMFDRAASFLFAVKRIVLRACANPCIAEMPAIRTIEDDSVAHDQSILGVCTNDSANRMSWVLIQALISEQTLLGIADCFVAHISFAC